MKPILYDAKGRPIRWCNSDGQVYESRAEQFAEWGGNPVTIIEPEPKITVHEKPKPPEIVEVENRLDPEQLRRAETLRRLGGGPLHKAEQAARKKRAETKKRVKMMIDGLMRRPVL